MEQPESIGELTTPDTLLVSILTSTVPSGIISDIRFPRQTKDAYFFTTDDIPGKKTLSFFGSEIPLLAGREINYEGEPILLTASKNESVLRQSEDGVRIEYDTNYTIHTIENPGPDRIRRMKHYRRGDSTKALREAERIFEETYQFPGLSPGICGNVGAWARYKHEALELFVTSGWIHHVRRAVSEALDMDPKRVTVHGVPAGSSHDALSWYPSLLGVYAALCSFHTGTPALVDLHEYARNSMFPAGYPVKAVFRTGIAKDGKILGREIDIDLDGGAYPAAPDLVLDRTCVSSLGIYGCPHFTVTGRVITTNNPPSDISSGAGLTPVQAAAEVHATRAALAAGRDPLRYRREAFQPPYEHTTGIRQKSALLRLSPLVEKVASASDFARKFGAFELNRKTTREKGGMGNRRRGIGLAVSFADGSLPGLAENEIPGTVSLYLDTKGTLSILSSTLPGHASTRDIWKKTAGAILGVSPEDVAVHPPDTDSVPDSGPGILSRNMTIIRTLIEKAAESIQRRRFRSPLPISVKRSFKLPKSTTWDTNTLRGTFFHRLTWAAWVVEVSFDPVLLQTTVTRIWGAVDCGRVIDRHGAFCALEEDIYGAMNHITGRSFPVSTGQVLPLSIEFIDTSRTEIHGVSNLACPGITAAYLAAVEQASYEPLYRIPVNERALFRHGTKT